MTTARWELTPYSSFGVSGPYPSLNKSSIDRSPIAQRRVISRTGLAGIAQPLINRPIGMRLQGLHSDFGVEDEKLDWLHRKGYGQVPAYLQRVQRVVKSEMELTLPPISSPRSPRQSPRSGMGSPRPYCTAYGLVEPFATKFAGGMIKPVGGELTPRPQLFGRSGHHPSSLAVPE